jgi:hypothetical protein
MSGGFHEPSTVPWVAQLKCIHVGGVGPLVLNICSLVDSTQTCKPVQMFEIDSQVSKLPGRSATRLTSVLRWSQRQGVNSEGCETNQ